MSQSAKLGFLLIIVLLTSCKSDPLNVDISNQKVELHIHRSEQEVFSTQKVPIHNYGEFMALYGQYVLQIGHPNDLEFEAKLKRFSQNEDMRFLFEESTVVFADEAKLKTNLNRAFSYYHYHFPTQVIPQVVTNISGLNYAVFTGDSTLGIGLDLFLGKEFEVYPLASFQAYQSNQMTPEQLIPQAMYGWLNSIYEVDKSKANMLERMIFEGKMLYALDAVLYNQPDSIKCGFSQLQMDWCASNQVNIWGTLIEKQLLYSTDHMTISKWMDPAPFISGLPKESPGRLGRWVGWQIVRSFMKNNPDITLPQLFTAFEAQKILTLSKYKPT